MRVLRQLFMFCVVAVLGFVDSRTVHAFAQKRPNPSQPIPPPGPTLEHGEIKLKVLSYNVHGLSVPGDDTERLGEIGELLKARRAQGTAPQIVAIQEGFHVDIVDLINNAGYPYRKDGPGPEWPRVGSGLIILSEYPIIEARGLAYDVNNSVGMDWNARKGAMYTKVRLPGLATPVEILDTHLQSDYDSASVPLSETIPARRRQIGELGKWFRSLTNFERPVIFAGDFNTNPRVGDYSDITAQTSLRDAAEWCLPPGQCAGNVNPDEDRNTSVDHQFIRSGAKVRVEPMVYEKTFRDPVKGRVLSDHDGLEVVYRVAW